VTPRERAEALAAKFDGIDDASGSPIDLIEKAIKEAENDAYAAAAAIASAFGEERGAGDIPYEIKKAIRKLRHSL
jgi:hypothetical protein